jgi:hypothetical protein
MDCKTGRTLHYGTLQQKVSRRRQNRRSGEDVGIEGSCCRQQRPSLPPQERRNRVADPSGKQLGSLDTKAELQTASCLRMAHRAHCASIHDKVANHPRARRLGHPLLLRRDARGLVPRNLRRCQEV